MQNWLKGTIADIIAQMFVNVIYIATWNEWRASS